MHMSTGRSCRRGVRSSVCVSDNNVLTHLRTIIVAPLTSTIKPYPFRLECRFDKRAGSVVLDHIRTVDRERLIKRLGVLSAADVTKLLKLLREMFEV